MQYLQITNPWLRRAAAEYLEQQGKTDLGVTEGTADIAVEVIENASARVAVQGHEMGEYALPLRLPELMGNLLWLAARRREDAEKTIQLNNDFVLEPRNFALRSGGITVAITGREVALLQFMLGAGECSKEKLLQEVWRYHPDSDTHTVETHLWRLRQKLQQAGISAPLILTTDNGYRIA